MRKAGTAAKNYTDSDSDSEVGSNPDCKQQNEGFKTLINFMGLKFAYHVLATPESVAIRNNVWINLQGKSYRVG